MIAAAQSVSVLGLRISAPLAGHFYYRLHRLRGGASLTTSGGSSTVDELALSSQSESSVVVVFAMSRYPAELVPALQFARSRGMSVVMFVDTPAASICHHGDHLIIAPVSTGFTFGSLTAAYLLSALLIDRIAVETTGESGRRLIDLEAVATHAGHYIDDSIDPPPR
jgi:DNA-binding MurR/RpiR family transcriptional regulator